MLAMPRSQTGRRARLEHEPGVEARRLAALGPHALAHRGRGRAEACRHGQQDRRLHEPPPSRSVPVDAITQTHDLRISESSRDHGGRPARDTRQNSLLRTVGRQRYGSVTVKRRATMPAAAPAPSGPPGAGPYNQPWLAPATAGTPSPGGPAAARSATTSPAADDDAAGWPDTPASRPVETGPAGSQHLAQPARDPGKRFLRNHNRPWTNPGPSPRGHTATITGASSADRGCRPESATLWRVFP